MRIWIDFSNSPHVLFFAPVVRELEKRGHQLFLTHREFAQTGRLLQIKNLPSTAIGQHGGQGVAKKIINITQRAFFLRKYAKDKQIDLAISHNSYAHCLAAKSMHIQYLTIMDYEYQPANHINFRLADSILTPFTFRIEEISKYGAKADRLIKYPGLKEEVYLWNADINKDFWKIEYPQLDSSKVMCTVRPPATMAAYHDFQNPFFDDLMDNLLSNKNVQLVFFARTEDQKKEYRRKFPNLYISEKSVDGIQLIANSDMVISAGGTMNREAAVLGTPAYTIYAGKMGSVDKHLVRTGKISIIQHAEDIDKIKIVKKKQDFLTVDRKVFDFIIDIIENRCTREIGG